MNRMNENGNKRKNGETTNLKGRKKGRRGEKEKEKKPDNQSKRHKQTNKRKAKTKAMKKENIVIKNIFNGKMCMLIDFN